MQENFLHFIYKNRLWTKSHLLCTNGDRIEIVDVGTHNHDSGPDFFKAKIKINNTLWVGNVEIHINSSDWYKHKHDKDLSYNNVILHIVYNYDKAVYIGNDKTEIPTWEIQFPHILLNKYYEFKNTSNHIPCRDYIEFTNSSKLELWLERIAIERLELKSKYIFEILESKRFDIESAFFIVLARSFGFGINSDAFEMLANSVPLNLIRKYSDNIFLIEAILFGQSGLLPDHSENRYIQSLIREYDFIKTKYDLEPIPKACWKFSRMRPNNFPEIRIAQLSSLMLNFQGLFSSIIELKNINEISPLFNIKTSEYWQSHYKFDVLANNKPAKFGKSSFNNIIINTISPFILVYLKMYKPCEDDIEKVIDWITKIKAEENRIIRAWKEINLIPKNAYQSQALTYLKKEYCDKKRCLNCNIGHQIFNKLNKI